MSPQLYEAINAKLLRIQGCLWNWEFWEDDSCRDALGKTIPERTQHLRDSYGAIERCRQDLKYEYLGLKDSWL